MKRSTLSKFIMVAAATVCLGSSDGKQTIPPPPRPIEADKAIPANTNRVNDDAAAVFSLQSIETKAAWLGRECAVIWFASDSKVMQEAELEKDILAAPILAKALGVPYDENQFRSAFNKTEHKAAGDFDSLFPEKIEKQAGSRVRDIYLFSFYCTASRHFVLLLPLWTDPEQQNVARKWVASPLAHAWKVAGTYDSALASKCHDLGLRSLSDSFSTSALADKFASEVLEMQKLFLLKHMTQSSVEMVCQPALKKRQHML